MPAEPKDFDKVIETGDNRYYLLARVRSVSGLDLPVVGIASQKSGNKWTHIGVQGFKAQADNPERQEIQSVATYTQTPGATTSGAGVTYASIGDLPENIRIEAAKLFAATAEKAGMAVRPNVLAAIRQGYGQGLDMPQEELERRTDVDFNRLMEDEDLDAKGAKLIAGERNDVLLDELSAALKSGDKAAVESAKERLKAAQAEKGEVDEAATLLGKPKNHFLREKFEDKHKETLTVAEAEEALHVDRLKKQRESGQDKSEGNSR